MIAATSRELSPIVTGILYCNTLVFCQDALEVAHALVVDARPVPMVRQPTRHGGAPRPVPGPQGGGPGAQRRVDRCPRCRPAHRRPVLHRGAEPPGQRQGALPARRDPSAPWGTTKPLRKPSARRASGDSEPQPGLALLRLDQRDAAAAASAIRRAVRETTQRLPRARLLPAFVHIMIAVGDLDAASSASAEIDEIARAQGTTVLRAHAAYAAGSVALAAEDPEGALVALRQALGLWLGLPAPYEVARTLARSSPARVEPWAMTTPRRWSSRWPSRRSTPWPRCPTSAGSTPCVPGPGGHGLTEREQDVLRLVAPRRSNREIASSLTIRRSRRGQARPEHPGQARRNVARRGNRVRSSDTAWCEPGRNDHGRPAEDHLGDAARPWRHLRSRTPLQERRAPCT